MIKTNNLVIGSGPAGAAAAMALKEMEQEFLWIDVGNDLDSVTENSVTQLAKQNPSDWSTKQQAQIFPPPITSSQGVEKRFIFGADYPYRVPKNLSIQTTDCSLDISHALGGFGNVWGAAVLPYTAHQLRDWPINLADLSDSYRNVSKYVPMTAQLDDLEKEYPLYNKNYDAQKVDSRTRYLLKGLTSKKVSKTEKMLYGRARLAVDSSYGSFGCQLCGRCLDGCVYQSIFNPRSIWKKLESERKNTISGLYVIGIEETTDHALVKVLNLKDQSVQIIQAKKVFLGAGNIATTRILCQSLNLIEQPIPIQDSQYFFFPFLSYKAHKTDIRFTLAELFIELTCRSISPETVHLQLYGMSSLIEQTIRNELPAFLPKQPFIDRFYVVQGFLSSEDSGNLELIVKPRNNDQEQIEIRGVANSRAKKVASKAQSFLRKKLLKAGIVLPWNLNVVAPGRSFHTGGSFPMGGKDPLLKSDIYGRPANFKKVHIIDSACFTNIPGSTIAYTIMANSDRIVRKTISMNQSSS